MQEVKVTMIFADGTSVFETFHCSGSDAVTITDSRFRPVWRSISDRDQQGVHVIRVFVKLEAKDLMEFSFGEIRELRLGRWSGFEPYV